MPGRSRKTAKPKQPDKTLPDRIADELIARIFTGELKAGDVLAPERVLAAELAVDRTSLRMALRQLVRMKLIRSVQGSGITVLDYRVHAGIDFLAAVLEVPGLELGGAMLLEALDHWNAAMPAVTALALMRATPTELAAIDALFAEQLALLDQRAPLAAVVELELRVHDAIFALAGSTSLGLLANSTRPLRRQLGLLAFGSIDPREQISVQRAQFQALQRRPGTPEQRASAHRAQLVKYTQPLRAALAALPANPRRTQRILPSKSARKIG
jgi:GntR family transcriptional regulator, transcriptional repressor for pyruvate dehydrogenase complex